MNGTKVAVLRGGPSDEYAVSMQTGLGVLQTLKNTKYISKDIIITKQGEWLSDGFVKNPEQALADVDIVFIALHGMYGEDGTVQRILERLAIPYTGSGPYASSMAMHKYHTKESLQSLGIITPKHMRVTKETLSDTDRLVQSISALFDGPYMVKPTKGGSSIGAVLAQNALSLRDAITKLFLEYDDILVEEYIKGREATVGVLEDFRNERYYMLPSIEIIPPKESAFFEAGVKYTGATEEICPGTFSRSEKDTLSSLAQQVHTHLGLSQYSRSDFIITNEQIYFLEVNTLPGLTPQSLFPKAMEVVGSSYAELIEHLLLSTLSRK